MSSDHERRLAKLEESHSETLAGLREMTAKIGELAGAINVSNERQSRVSDDINRVEENQRDLGKRVRDLERQQESFRPYVELMKQINARMWMVLMGVMGTGVMMAYKLIG